MKCHKCGDHLIDGQMYCLNCGTNNKAYYDALSGNQKSERKSNWKTYEARQTNFNYEDERKAFFEKAKQTIEPIVLPENYIKDIQQKKRKKRFILLGILAFLFLAVVFSFIVLTFIKI